MCKKWRSGDSGDLGIFLDFFFIFSSKYFYLHYLKYLFHLLFYTFMYINEICLEIGSFYIHFLKIFTLLNINRVLLLTRAILKIDAMKSWLLYLSAVMILLLRRYIEGMRLNLKNLSISILTMIRIWKIYFMRFL
jgi:hypothetical protein